jgi:hypothetical protein
VCDVKIKLNNRLEHFLINERSWALFGAACVPPHRRRHTRSARAARNNAAELSFEKQTSRERR